jgi:tetratricopeptide (TPR) repeat protein
LNAPLKEAARLYAARDYKAAEAVCRTITNAGPRHFDALHLLGVLLTLQDRPEDAVIYLRKAEAEWPDHVQLRVNLGNALLAAKRYGETVTVSRTGDAAALNNLGLAYRGLQQHEAAANAFRQAAQARWDYAPAWFNLANTLKKLGQLEPALQAATTALRVAPLDTPVARLADATNEIGQILLDLGRPEEALVTCRRFLKRHPDQTAVIWNMSLCLLLLGQFEEGRRAYEHRFDIAGHDKRPDEAIVLDPEQVAGKRVLILTEQGRGDMLQFIRYAPLLAEKGAIVAVQAYPDLVPLLAAMPGLSMVVSTDDPPPEADVVTSVMSLPLAFGTRPANVPYLSVPTDRPATTLGPSAQPRIGVAWSGSPHSRERSAIPADILAPLLALPGFEFPLPAERDHGNRPRLVRFVPGSHQPARAAFARFCRHRCFGRSNERDRHRRHSRRSPCRRDGQTGEINAAFQSRLALDVGAAGQPVVPHHAAISPAGKRRLDSGRPGRDCGVEFSLAFGIFTLFGGTILRLQPQAALQRQAGTEFGIVRGHHRVVRWQPPFRPIFVRGHAMHR